MKSPLLICKSSDHPFGSCLFFHLLKQFCNPLRTRARSQILLQADLSSTVKRQALPGHFPDTISMFFSAFDVACLHQGRHPGPSTGGYPGRSVTHIQSILPVHFLQSLQCRHLCTVTEATYKIKKRKLDEPMHRKLTYLQVKFIAIESRVLIISKFRSLFKVHK